MITTPIRRAVVGVAMLLPLVGEAVAMRYVPRTTTARLECNQFLKNHVNQILCEGYSDVVMNAQGQQTADNFLTAVATDLWCGTCTPWPDCQCNKPPWGFAPLMYLSKSYPALMYGYNTFRFEQNGSYLYDESQCCPLTYAIR